MFVKREEPWKNLKFSVHDDKNMVWVFHKPNYYKIGKKACNSKVAYGILDKLIVYNL